MVLEVNIDDIKEKIHLNYDVATKLSDNYILPMAVELFALSAYAITRIEAHDGGRNIAYNCEKENCQGKILRIIYLKDRSKKDILAELEFVNYLANGGVHAAKAFPSQKENLLEAITYNGHTFYVCLFEKAKGKLLVENNYTYREGVPLSEYFYNCGKTLGKMHQLSKGYEPQHKRYSFFDKYTNEYIQKLIPERFLRIREKLLELIDELKKLEITNESFGLIHFDYCDGNYMIDFDNGQITVFDFDNACDCFYMFELATLWTQGVGWIQFESDIEKRKAFMVEYFDTILSGYKSETVIEDNLLTQLQLFIKLTILENIVDAFEVALNEGEELADDGELAYLFKCLEDDIPYKGFFHDIYSCDAPFEYEE